MSEPGFIGSLTIIAGCILMYATLVAGLYLVDLLLDGMTHVLRLIF